MKQRSPKVTSVTVNSSISTFLSCDSLEDAIRSLALAYQVREAKITQVFDSDWPEFLGEDEGDEIFKDNLLTWCMAQHMKCGDVSDCTLSTAHYHRGLFNGDKRWYENGLLNSKDGAAAFLECLRPKLPQQCNFDMIESLTFSNISDRRNGEPDWGGGPYAFDRLSDAICAQIGGLDYSTPEFFRGRHWDIVSKGQCSSCVIIDICKQNFSPVIVKFLAPNARIQAYVNNLWHYLHQQKFGYELRPNNYTFAGCGVTVSSERILELITEF